MLCEKRQHVVKKANACVHTAPSRPIQQKGKANIRFRGFSDNLALSHVNPLSAPAKYPSTTINTHVTKTVKIVCATKPQSTLTE